MTTTELVMLIWLFFCGTALVSGNCPVRLPDGTLSIKGLLQQAWIGLIVAGVPFGFGKLIEWLL